MPYSDSGSRVLEQLARIHLLLARIKNLANTIDNRATTTSAISMLVVVGMLSSVEVVLKHIVESVE